MTCDYLNGTLPPGDISCHIAFFMADHPFISFALFMIVSMIIVDYVEKKYQRDN